MRDIVEGDNLETGTIGEGTVEWKTVEKVSYTFRSCLVGWQELGRARVGWS